ncbi:MAG: cell division protein ZapA [Elusimicrobia bacterium]|nr:cell division protein ZapA [Elusimicrobiota bacterium]
MKDELITVSINKITLEDVSIEGLNPLEAPFIAGEVEKKMKQIEHSTGIVDTLKLALLAAISFASDDYMKEQELNSLKQSDASSLQEMILELESCLKNQK